MFPGSSWLVLLFDKFKRICAASLSCRGDFFLEALQHVQAAASGLVTAARWCRCYLSPTLAATPQQNPRTASFTMLATLSFVFALAIMLRMGGSVHNVNAAHLLESYYS